MLAARFGFATDKGRAVSDGRCEFVFLYVTTAVVPLLLLPGRVTNGFVQSA